MKKMKVKTNQGKVFDFFLNAWINLVLWWEGIGVWKETDLSDEDLACSVIAREVLRVKRIFNI